MNDNSLPAPSGLNSEGPLTFGLDIGIASVGWAVLSSKRVVDLGVRAFDKAETADKGESLNLARRTARLLRRRLWRRSWRLLKLARLLRNSGLIATTDFFKSQPGFNDSPWTLRVAGLDRLLSAEEWARVLYHLCKHRGFHWVSKAEQAKAESDSKSEGGRVKAGLAHTQALMNQKGYRTAAEMVLAEFPDAQRNKRGDYGKALSRSLLDLELTQLFAAQRRLGNSHASEALEAAVRGAPGQRGGLFWEQRPMQSVLSMLGHCTFEPTEYRAPKASFTAERHVWLTRLNNLRINDTGVVRPLTETERQILIDLPYRSAEKFTYKHVRSALEKAGLSSAFRFNGLSYPSDKQRDEERAKNPEDQVLIRLSAWHELRQALKKAGLEAEWQQLSVAALDGQPDMLDEVGRVLSVYKNDDEISAGLQALPLPGGSRTVDALLGLRFDKFHALSTKALRRIVPLMERGLRYDEAVAKIPEYGHHSQRYVVGSGRHKYLPPFYIGRDERGSMRLRDDMDVPRNPVVLRSLNQARKVVNALIRVYGAPAAVHIEMARDLSRPLDERRDIEKLQEEYRARNDQTREHFAELFGRKPTGAELEKWLLYREQDGKCAYSLAPLDIASVVGDPSYVQVDHALPYSRSYDDGKNNKVLALTRENQNKGNRTPYEYLDGESDSERWRNFVAWVQGNKNYRQAKRSRLLRKNFGKEEASSFRDRNLNDTRYICRFFKNYVEQHLQLALDGDSRRCVVVSGQLTSFLRARWGLLKIREESDRHHALDAVVVAACSHAMVKRLADHARLKELEFLREGFPDPETGEIINPQAHQRLSERFPEPWPHFRHEVDKRLRIDSPELLREEMSRLGTYPSTALAALKPIFVSRAPQRRNGGAVHKDTIYSQTTQQKEAGSVSQKVALSSLTIKDLENLVDPVRNEKLYAAIRERLAAHGGKAEKAFPPDNPLRKPDKDGLPTGPVVRSVKVSQRMSGISVRGGIAKNESMIRVDVFKKDAKFYLVPVYVHHKVTGLPIRAIAQKKDEGSWTVMDSSFDFLFSLHANDLVYLEQRGSEPLYGYFRSCHSGAETISISLHDRNKYGNRTASLAILDKDPRKKVPNDKLGLIENLGVKTAIRFEKLHVDTLGRVFPAPPEKRRGLA